MEMFALVRPEYLNQFGSLFGGQMLKWVDEFSWLAASRDFPGARLVTRAMTQVDFTRGVENGAILRFHIVQTRRGVSSVSYAARVYSRGGGSQEETLVFETTVTFVCIDGDGRKTPLPPANQ